MHYKFRKTNVKNVVWQQPPRKYFSLQIKPLLITFLIGRWTNLNFTVAWLRVGILVGGLQKCLLKCKVPAVRVSYSVSNYPRYCFIGRHFNSSCASSKGLIFSMDLPLSLDGAWGLVKMYCCHGLVMFMIWDFYMAITAGQLFSSKLCNEKRLLTEPNFCENFSFKYTIDFFF